MVLPLASWLILLLFSLPNVDGSNTFQRNLELHSKKIEESFHLRITDKEYMPKQSKEQQRQHSKDDNDSKDDDDDDDDDDKRKEKSESNDSKSPPSNHEQKSKSSKNSKKPTQSPKQEKPVKKPKGCRRQLSATKSKTKVSKKESSASSKRDKYDDDKSEQSDNDDKAQKYHDDESPKRQEKYDNPDGKEEKLDDKNNDDDDDECYDPPTDPPNPTRAPSPPPALPASEEDIDIPLEPYFVLYEIQQTRIPLLSDYDELTAFTSSYLDNYFRFIFADTVEIEYVKSTTALVGSEFRLAQPVRIDYSTNVTFTSTSLIPGTSELETLITGAFEGENGEAYAAAVAAGLSPNNIFSTTSVVSYSLSEAMPPRLRLSRLGTAMFSALVALMVLVYRNRWTTNSSDETTSLVKSDDDDHHRQMRNATASWKAGIAHTLTKTIAYETVESKPEKICS